MEDPLILDQNLGKSVQEGQDRGGEDTQQLHLSDP